MSNVFRFIAIRINALPRHVRTFHSPFAALYNPKSAASTPIYQTYEKQTDHSPDPQRSPLGTHTYVVSEPDPTHKPYAVPSGAYSVATPFTGHSIASDPPKGEGLARVEAVPKY